ncbi:hypothetical protein [Jeotgalicoccus psychrophilus]|uniref:hypothetical protein n=1 Tax=Jeotgalicoccus psychrophilus TaxID=157228 RepID=UPI0003F89988|nr:hypothetical protein [Jeotgalicoccus psychrophilus]
MKHIYLTHALNMESDAVLFSYPDFNTPNLILPKMQRELTPDSEIYITINNFYETNDFMIENTLIETIRQESAADGFIIDQIFTRDFHDVNTVLLETLSSEIRNKHFIIGPSFTKVPYFLHSRLAEIFIDHDVSGVMYDLRDIDIRNFSQLQPLAKLKMHVKKRLSIIPLIRPEQLKDLKKSIPFEVAVIEQ